MITSILVPTDGSNSANQAMELTLELASLAHADIEGLFVIYDIPLYPSVHALAMDAGAYMNAEVMNIHTQSREEAEKILAGYSDRCEARGVPFTGRIEEGEIPQTICEVAHTVDIIVMGKHGRTPQQSRQAIGSVISSVIRNAIRPVIVVPESYQKIESVIVAYDGSRQASHALMMATDFVTLYNVPLHVLTASDSTKEREFINAEAMKYLSHHSILAEPILASNDPKEAIIAAASVRQNSIVIMGAYGDNRLKEFLLGSTTEAVVTKTYCPVLLYR
jgi:nucleotide-binding universal stress UspA family protein